MELKKQLEDKIFDMEKVAIAFDVEPFDIYFLGGAACILGEYTERAVKLNTFKYLNVYLLSPERYNCKQNNQDGTKRYRGHR